MNFSRESSLPGYFLFLAFVLVNIRIVRSVSKKRKPYVAAGLLLAAVLAVLGEILALTHLLLMATAAMIVGWGLAFVYNFQQGLAQDKEKSH
ncbi:MAG: hypothetical protein ACUVRF_01555 [Desulfotomaculales bacterium]